MGTDTTPRVSVVMPCFNAARFLRPAVESILEQTFSDLELLAVDDGSTDETLEILRTYSRDARLRVVSLPHVGISATLNRGLKEARADLVARMDADDVAHPTRIDVQARFMEEHPDFVAIGTAMRVVDGGGQFLRLATRPEWEMMDIDFRSNPLLHPTVMMRRQPVLALGGYRTGMDGAEDFDLWLRLVSAGHAITNLTAPLLDYRLHGGNASSKSAISAAAHAVALLEFRTRMARRGRDIIPDSERLPGTVPWKDFDPDIRQSVRADYLKRLAKARYSGRQEQLQQLRFVEREVRCAAREEPPHQLIRPMYLLARGHISTGRFIPGLRWFCRALFLAPREVLLLVRRDAISRRRGS